MTRPRRSPLSPVLFTVALATAGCLLRGHPTSEELHREAVDLHSQALALEAQGKWREAVTLYQRSITIAPTPVAHCRLALCQAELGALESAENHLRMALELSPSYQLAQTHLLRLQAERQARGASETGYSAEHPESRQVGQEPQGLQSASSNTSPALPTAEDSDETTDAATGAMPSVAEVRALLFPNLHGEADASGAQRLRETRLDSPDFHLVRAAAFEREGHHVSALREYRLAFEREPSRIGALLAAAKIHAHLGHLETAMETYERALELEPDDADIPYEIGNHFYRQGDHERANLFYQRALVLDPDHRNAHNNLGAALRELGRLEEAIIHLERAIEIDPEFARPHRNLGNIHAQLGDAQAALDAYRRYVSLGGPDAETVSGWIRTLERELGSP